VPETACTIRGCDRRQHARRLCMTHWMRWYKTGHPLGTADLRDMRPLHADEAPGLPLLPERWPERWNARPSGPA
jgi:hypothetical protein